MKWLNDPRLRSILAGGFGGLFGWYIAESILGAPKSFMATLAFGLFSGLGIGVCLGIAEGLVLRSRIQARRRGMDRVAHWDGWRCSRRGLRTSRLCGDARHEWRGSPSTCKRI